MVEPSANDWWDWPPTVSFTLGSVCHCHVTEVQQVEIQTCYIVKVWVVLVLHILVSQCLVLLLFFFFLPESDLFIVGLICLRTCICKEECRR